jgi:hypothetical protein
VSGRAGRECESAEPANGAPSDESQTGRSHYEERHHEGCLDC